MPDQHNRAVAGLYGLNLWLIRLAGWLILGITVVTVFGVFMRYALRAPEVWSYPLSAYLLCLVVMTWLLWKLFAETVQRGRIDETTLGWPLAAIQWCLPAGIALLLLTHVVVSWSEFARARRPPAQGHGEQTF